MNLKESLMANERGTFFYERVRDIHTSLCHLVEENYPFFVDVFSVVVVVVDNIGPLVQWTKYLTIQ